MAWEKSLEALVFRRGSSHDKAVLLGATTEGMQIRLDYLKQLWCEGVRFKEVVWLTGDRPLDKRVDRLTERCKCESEAARVIWEENDLPDEMRALPVVFVAVPMKGDIGPNTIDTLRAWLNLSPEPCTALFVSNQPFCGAQHAIIKAHLPGEIDFDLVGPGVDTVQHPAGAAVILDVIGCWISFEK
jgi:hypothetical protein